MAAPKKPPTLHVIAGPNGAGKSTLYANQLQKRYPNVEFVNADLLALAHFGHSAATEAESKVGQQLAEARRAALMQEGKSLVFESTFSHPSKLDELRAAQAAGYQIAVYHVNVASSNISVARVAARVTDGGHDVPEDKTRERFVRNQPLIREAVLMADTAKVFDNTKIAQPHTLAIAFERGQVVAIHASVPAWARELYAKELDRYSPEQISRGAVSFSQGAAMVQEKFGADARTFVARRDGNYTGRVIGETSMHVLQQVGRDSVIAHFKRNLDRVPPIGERSVIIYDLQQNMRAHTRDADAAPLPALDAARRGRIDRAVQLVELAAKHIPVAKAGTLAPALASVAADGSQRVRSIMETHPDALERFERSLKRHEATLAPYLQRQARQRRNDPDRSR